MFKLYRERTIAALKTMSIYELEELKKSWSDCVVNMDQEIEWINKEIERKAGK